MIKKLDGFTDDREKEVVAVGASLDIAAVETLVKEVEAFNVTYFAEKYNDCSERLNVVKTTVEENDRVAAEEAAKEATEKLAAKKKVLSARIYTAGIYTVGIDIEYGVYNAVANSGNGNFVVYDGSNKLLVNEILGVSSDYASPSYSNVQLKVGGTITITSNLGVTFEPVR